ncbi:MAG TPA: hypothetical protein VFK42_08310 [Acidimicrobiales bacterium]|nr:hypothetical protein [Acidimicrobiales bacterium]
MDLFSDALALVDEDVPGDEAAVRLVAAAGGSVERLLEAERRARALERALPGDGRARRLHFVIRDAARVAVRTPSDVPPSSSLSDRLAEVTGSADTPHTIDIDQLAADLERLRAPGIAPLS